MFDYLLKTAPPGTPGNWATFLASQKSNLAEAGPRTVAAPTDRAQALWNGKSGLCTLLPLKLQPGPNWPASSTATRPKNEIGSWPVYTGPDGRSVGRPQS